MSFKEKVVSGVYTGIMKRKKYMLAHCIRGVLLFSLITGLNSFARGEFAGQAKSEETLTAQQILTKTEEVYSSCQTYQDEGSVKTIFLSDDGKRTVKRPFQTSFVRPGQFRFEFQERRGEDEWDKLVVWRNAEAVKTCWTLTKEIDKGNSLDQALWGAKGVSGKSSYEVPRLLMPTEIKGEKVTTIANAKLVGVESIEGDFRCYKIKGQNWRKEPMMIWIDKESFMIRQIQEHMKLKDFETESVTTYKPQINIKIDNKDLNFSKCF